MKKYNILMFCLFLLMVPFSLGASLNGSSSIYTFNVTNCQADNYFVNCSPATIRFSCDITNSAFIDFTEFKISGSLYNATRIGQNWYYDYLKPNQTSTVNTTINFTRIYITDTNSDTAVFDEDNISIVNDCVTCTDVGYQDVCSIFDNTTFYHVYEPTNCSANYNETINCNYCSEDLQQTLGDCQINNSQTVQYSDLNYFSCCAVTSIGNDCSILSYPYNETTNQNCSFLTQDFQCDFPNLAELKSKMPFSCLMNDSDDYRCVVNVFEDERLIQVNPEYKQYSTGLLTIRGKDIETKEYFTPENRLLNVYFTNKNLLTDKQFKVEVKCSSLTNVYESQYLVNPFYNTASGVLNRFKWSKDNMVYLLVWSGVIMLGILLTAFALSQLRGRKTSR